MTRLLPGDRMWVQRNDGPPFASQLLEVGDDGSHLIGVEDDTAQWPPGRATVVTLVWHSERGRHEQQAGFLGAGATAPPSWWVRPRDTAEVVQRRYHVRAPRLTDVEIACRDGLLIDATALDLSEGGMRCLLPHGVRLVPQEKLTVSFRCEDGRVTVPGWILRTNRRPDDRLEIALQLQAHPADADRIWRLVLRWQRQARERGLL